VKKTKTAAIMYVFCSFQRRMRLNVASMLRYENFNLSSNHTPWQCRKSTEKLRFKVKMMKLREASMIFAPRYPLPGMMSTALMEVVRKPEWSLANKEGVVGQIS
jgi:hypothetical protein